MTPVREVAFELEAFEWSEDRLDVAGRWKGLTGRRLARPVLTVQLDSGRRKRIVAMPGGHMGTAGESWHASFNWPGDPAEIIGAATRSPRRRSSRRSPRSCGSRPARCAPRSTGCGPSWPGASAS